MGNTLTTSSQDTNILQETLDSPKIELGDNLLDTHDNILLNKPVTNNDITSSFEEITLLNNNITNSDVISYVTTSEESAEDSVEESSTEYTIYNLQLLSHDELSNVIKNLSIETLQELFIISLYELKKNTKYISDDNNNKLYNIQFYENSNLNNYNIKLESFYERKKIDNNSIFNCSYCNMEFNTNYKLKIHEDIYCKYNINDMDNVD